MELLGLANVVLAIVSVFFLSGSVASADAGGGVDFGYTEGSANGPRQWGHLSPDWAMCKDGRQQSPVHIRTNISKVDSSLSALNTSYIPSSAVLFNDGHALEVDVDNNGNFTVDGEVYTLVRFHFHSPSEHVIDDVRPPLEMHMVHQSADGKLAVIGIPFRKGAASPFLDEFWGMVPMVTKKLVKVDIGQLLADAPHLSVGPTYARYQGSLTTPPCTQNVLWTVALQQWNTISEEQIKAFRSVLPTLPYHAAAGGTWVFHPSFIQKNQVLDPLKICMGEKFSFAWPKLGNHSLHKLRPYSS